MVKPIWLKDSKGRWVPNYSSRFAREYFMKCNMNMKQQSNASNHWNMSQHSDLSDRRDPKHGSYSKNHWKTKPRSFSWDHGNTKPYSMGHRDSIPYRDSSDRIKPGHQTVTLKLKPNMSHKSYDAKNKCEETIAFVKSYIPFIKMQIDSCKAFKHLEEEEMYWNLYNEAKNSHKLSEGGLKLLCRKIKILYDVSEYYNRNCYENDSTKNQHVENIESRLESDIIKEDCANVQQSPCFDSLINLDLTKKPENSQNEEGNEHHINTEKEEVSPEISWLVEEEKKEKNQEMEEDAIWKLLDKVVNNE